MPNGHILALLWRSYPGERWVSEGRDPALTSPKVWGTWIVEIDPEAPQEEAIVWSWEAIDHLVQSFDPNRPSFGSPDQHPGKLNVNYQAFADDPDWLHVNSVAYHPELDQIMLSSRDFSEIWVLDHSVPAALTSTDAGDLLYRGATPPPTTVAHSTTKRGSTNTTRVGWTTAESWCSPTETTGRRACSARWKSSTHP